jgi:hypothetical protein
MRKAPERGYLGTARFSHDIAHLLATQLCHEKTFSRGSTRIERLAKLMGLGGTKTVVAGKAHPIYQHLIDFCWASGRCSSVHAISCVAAVIIKLSTLLKLHEAFKKRKYSSRLPRNLSQLPSNTRLETFKLLPVDLLTIEVIWHLQVSGGPHCRHTDHRRVCGERCHPAAAHRPRY